jgi:hypothetical protein
MYFLNVFDEKTDKEFLVMNTIVKSKSQKKDARNI